MADIVTAYEHGESARPTGAAPGNGSTGGNGSSAGNGTVVADRADRA